MQGRGLSLPARPGERLPPGVPGLIIVISPAVQGIKNEKNIPAKQGASGAQTRFSDAHGNARRSSRNSQATRKRPQTSGAKGLIIRPLAFPPERRIRKRRDFQALYASGKKIHAAHYLLFVDWLQGRPQRVGFAVSRKIGNAVARNRVKRVLREFFRAANFCLPGAQIAVVAKKGAPLLGLADAAAELGPILRRMAKPGAEAS